ncbi:MAG: PilN domain-containing protein [Pseudomonadota bacterium]
MTRINLLPWREQQRKERERQFYTVAGGAVVMMLLVVGYIHIHVSGLIDQQKGRNDFMTQEIAAVDAQIAEIKELEAEKSQLLARMKVIEQLQSQRPQMVHLFDELVKSIPEGVYLTSVKQNGSSVIVEGVAQSNARVSAFMRNIDQSAWMSSPKLNVIESTTKDGQRASKFVLDIKQITESAAAPNPDATS